MVERGELGQGQRTLPEVAAIRVNSLLVNPENTIFAPSNTINMNPFIILGFMGLGTTELIVILVVVLLLFGGRKIPEFMKGLGKGIREFKDETKGGSNQPSTPEKKD